MRDPNTGEEMNLRQAVQRGIIYKDSVIYDTETMRLITLERAIKSGMIDGNTGRYVLSFFIGKKKLQVTPVIGNL